MVISTKFWPHCVRGLWKKSVWEICAAGFQTNKQRFGSRNFGIHSLSLLKSAGGVKVGYRYCVVCNKEGNFCAFDTLSSESRMRNNFCQAVWIIVTRADVFLQDLDTFTLQFSN